MDKKRDIQKNMELEDVLGEFGGLFQEMEGTLQSFEVLYADIEFAMDDIRDEMEQLQESLDECAAALRAYSRQERRERIPHLSFREKNSQ